MANEEPSYIDYDTFLDPDFSATSFANSLVLSTNDPTDTLLDLSTPLSRVLFDVQEIDIHIDNLTTKSAGPLLDYTQSRSDASSRILDEVSAQLEGLNEGYRRLEKDVIARYERAEEVRLAAERLCATLKLGRTVSRCFNLGRQLEAQMGELGITASSALTSSSVTSSNTAKVRENHRAMVGAARSVLELRSVVNSHATPGLERITTVTALRNNLLTPLERSLISLAQQTVREFSVSSLPASSGTSSTGSNPTFLQSEQAKSRTTSALTTLYLLSPCPPGTRETTFEPRLLLSALTSYLQANITSSQASLARALATLPTLDRTLTELSGRCANIVALETVLATTSRGAHPSLSAIEPTSTIATKKSTQKANADSDSDSDSDSNMDSTMAAPVMTISQSAQQDFQDAPLLPLILSHLDTSSLQSYFWRTLASGLAPRVADILGRGGVSARTLRSNKDRVASAVRECVLSSSSASNENVTAGGVKQSWDREAAVMVGGILGPLGR